jgi:hypothetical protein
MKKLLLFLLLALPAYAQNSNGQATDIRKGASLPVTCGAGQIFYKTTSPIGQHQCINGVWVYMGAGGVGANGRDGADGAPGTNGYTPNQIISGCGVGYVSGFTWTISACNYWLGNVQLSAPQATVSGPAADDTFDRFDVIAVDKNGVFSVVQGVAQDSPAKPVLDPSEQTEITFYRVNAGATTPTDVSILNIYDEGAEWPCTVSATANCTSTVNPFMGTKDVEGTNMPQGAFIRFTIPVGTLDIAAYRDLIYHIAPKAPLGTHSLTYQWYNGTTPKCTPVSVFNNQFGFTDGTTSYEQIVVPLSTFNCSGIPVTRLQITVAGSATSTVGLYLDHVYLQGGVTNSIGVSGMQWKGLWINTQVYKIQETVTRNGSLYVAIATNSGLDPATHPEAWDAGDCHQPAGVDGNIQIKSGNCYAPINSSYDTTTQTVTFGGPIIAGGTTNQGITLKASTSPTVSAATEIKFISNAGTCQVSQNGGAFTNCSSAFGGTAVTSIATTSPITGGTITTTGTIACPTCAIGPGASTANHLAKFSGTDGLTLADGGAIPAGTVTSIATTSPLGGGTITGSGTLTCTTCVVASSPGAGVAHFAGSTQTLTSSAIVGSDMTNNTVTSTQTAVVNTRRTCMIQVGDGTNTVVTADYSPFLTGACYIPYAATVVEINIQSDAGTPSVVLERRRGAATLADLLSGALAAAGTTHTCAMASTAQTCIDGTTSSGSITLSNTSLSAGDVIEVKSGTGSTEKSMRIAVVFTVN